MTRVVLNSGLACRLDCGFSCALTTHPHEERGEGWEGEGQYSEQEAFIGTLKHPNTQTHTHTHTHTQRKVYKSEAYEAEVDCFVAIMYDSLTKQKDIEHRQILEVRGCSNP